MDRASSGTDQRLINPVLIAGCIIIMVSFSVRASFGLFQLPIALEFAWPRESFSLAIALQNLFWGIGQPIFGAFAERYGDRRAILAGGAFYVVGLVLSAYAITPGQHQLLEMLVGFGIAGTGFGVILAVVGRAAPDKHRSMALGLPRRRALPVRSSGRLRPRRCSARCPGSRFLSSSQDAFCCP